MKQKERKKQENKKPADSPLPHLHLTLIGDYYHMGASPAGIPLVRLINNHHKMSVVVR